MAASHDSASILLSSRVLYHDQWVLVGHANGRVDANISVQYREKMTLLYVIFQLFFWYRLLKILHEIYLNRTRFAMVHSC
ncbi:MAG: hypothetical protein ISEC1_P0705 [Thiomicrorhabdus sp.]|nr:MAG: hypothetical protein ISEC1_P0705 [Thiomicrorhabdus sp.]